MSLFSAVDMAPRDPILGLNEQFATDANPNKVNLGVGVYYDDAGKLPLLACVQAAEVQLGANPKPRGYLPMDGIAAYDGAVKALVFGPGSEPLQANRVATVQALGGTGALRLGADLLYQMGSRKALISNPSWENHRGIFQRAGFAVDTYAYYNETTRGVDFAGMLDSLQQAAAGTVVVLHACCHNPTGYDLTAQQWQAVTEVVKQRQLVPFLDMAYQGFRDSIEADGAAVHAFVAAGIDCLVATSFSKSFSLYGERVGALSVVCQSADESARVLSQLKLIVRTNYSNPPTHGAALVATVLGTPELRQQWEAELGSMRERIKAMRAALVQGLAEAGVTQDVSFITEQAGMFSYSGLSAEQMQRLRSEFGVYGVNSGRICVAALNTGNVAYVCQAMAAVMKHQAEVV